MPPAAPTATAVPQGLIALGNLTGVPVVQAIAGTAAVIFEAANGARFNQSECVRVAQLVEETLGVLQTELSPDGELPIEVVSALETLHDTLQRISEFVRQQAQASFIRRVLAANAVMTEKTARGELAHALQVFQLQCSIYLGRKLNELEESRVASGQRVLDLLDQDRSTELRVRQPPKPGKLLGRNSELRRIVSSVTAMSSEPARLAILGGGGMGKSTSALNAMHHPEVVEAFGDYRYFVSCESAESAGGLLSVIATHLQISGDQLRKRVLAALGSTKLLLVLDNFETPWEEHRQRVEVEQLLGLVAALSNVTLMVTMRGSERPLATSWSTPALEPLKPLDLTAARHIFADVACLSSQQEESSETLELLGLLDGIPLAITLAASVVRDTSVAEVLASWRTEGTTALQSPISARQRLSSLDNSIRLSIESSRVADVPQALELLQLLALLPSGLAENFQHPAIRSMRRATSALKSSLLAYSIEGGYLRSLCPIRTYIRGHHPPPYGLAAPLEQHYREIAKLSRQLGTDRTKPLLEQLVPEWANVESVCAYVLEMNAASWPIAVVADFDCLLFHMGIPRSDILQRPVDPTIEPSDRLKVLLRRVVRESNRDSELKLAREAAALADEVGNRDLFVESRIRLAVALRGHSEARRHLDDALAAARSSGSENTRQVGQCLLWLSNDAYISDDYTSCIEYGVQAIVCFDKAKHILATIQARTKLTNTYLQLGHTRKAAAIVAGCIERCDEIGSLQLKPVVLEIVATIAYARGEFLEAKRLNEESCRFYRRLDRQSSVAYQLETISATLIQLGDIVSARRIFEEARALKPERNSWEEIMHQLREALVLVAEGVFDLAGHRVRAALRLSRLRKAARLEISVHGILGEIALRRARDISNPEAAAKVVRQGLNQFILQLVLCARINNMVYLIPCIGRLGEAFWHSEITPHHAKYCLGRRIGRLKQK